PREASAFVKNGQHLRLTAVAFPVRRMPVRQPGRHKQVYFARTEAWKNLSVAALHNLDGVAKALENLAHDRAGDGVERERDLAERNFAGAFGGAGGRAEALQKQDQQQKTKDGAHPDSSLSSTRPSAAQAPVCVERFLRATRVSSAFPTACRRS